ncbi:ABC transporter substrate-binding protein [Aureimonas leprariae]|uniref:ABC transporter substrate-binding protein n=1 Tax=Plantimonas leprariae TaxID=2615207 RepID=A0A7V7PMB2_9HYPH|nr:ABC transporter substrate-binding protein [Aureimonas leprariae]KAB0677801.1 ABC transporter substrate-binding protein [Aureimonas leprariae]
MQTIRRFLLALLAALPALVASQASLAEGHIRIVQQFGTIYLPLHVMRDQKLIEKHAKALGLDEPRVEWLQLSGGAAINDAILSGSVDVAAAGIGPFLTLWDRSRGKVRIIGGLAHQANYLVTSNPAIRTLADFGPNDKIAMPAAGVSVQARVLQMAAEKAFGEGGYDRLYANMITLPHPDAMAALLTGSTEITAHLSNTPYQEQALRDPKVHRIFSSYDVLGGPVTPTYVYSLVGFRDDNPKTFQAFFEAFKEASAWIEANKAEAAKTYIRVEGSKLDPAFVQSLLESPESLYTLVPAKSFDFASFMYRIGAIRTEAKSWKDYTFEELHGENGS